MCSEQSAATFGRAAVAVHYLVWNASDFIVVIPSELSSGLYVAAEQKKAINEYIQS